MTTYKSLEEARAFEKKQFEKYQAELRPLFHLTPMSGWMNDPNGFSYYKGKYHLFYQYYPYATRWDYMHWGHAVSSDLLHWTYLPCALAPDKEYDRDGVFSGTALVENDEHVLMYTSVKIKNKGETNEEIRQEQSIAIGDGENYQKLENNPVISSELLPEGFNKEDFRDPKIWRENDNFYAIVAHRAEDKSGQILLFKSADLREWQYQGSLLRSNKEIGLMWECPDLLKLDEQRIMIISPQNLEAKEDYHAGNASFFLFGDLDLDAVSFNLEKIQYIDYGTDFYAPQTCTDPNGRTVLVGWAKSWDGPVHIDNMHWTGMMTIPRELSLVDGVLRQKPISTIESLRKNTVCKVCELDSELVELEEIRARVLDINLELEAGASAENFTLSLAKGDKYKTDISFGFASEKLTIDRTFAGIRQDIVMKRSMPIEMSDSKISFRVLIDRYVIEVFAQDGEKVMTSLINTPIEMDGLSLSASGSVKVSLEAHELEL